MGQTKGENPHSLTLLPLHWAQSVGKQAVLGEQDPGTMSNCVCVCPSVFPPPFRIFNPSLPRSAVLWMTEQEF